MGSGSSKVSYDVRVPVHKHHIKNIVDDATRIIPDVSEIVADYAQNLFIKYLCDKWNKIFSDKKDTLPDLNLDNYKVNTHEACSILHSLYLKHHEHDGFLLISVYMNTEHNLFEVITFNDGSDIEKYKIMDSQDGTFKYHRIYNSLNQSGAITVDNFIIFFDRMINFYISTKKIGHDHYLFKSCKPPKKIPAFSKQDKQDKQYVDGTEIPYMEQLDGGFFNRSNNLFHNFHPLKGGVLHHCY